VSKHGDGEDACDHEREMNCNHACRVEYWYNVAHKCPKSVQPEQSY
jgi:hypothetical protein